MKKCHSEEVAAHWRGNPFSMKMPVIQHCIRVRIATPVTSVTYFAMTFNILLFNPADIRPQSRQLFHNILIAPLDKVDVLHIGHALGGKPRDDQCRAGP